MTATDAPETIGLVPAAGRAARLGVLPCSKEVLPVGIDDDGRVRVAADDLLAAFAAAGAGRAFVVVRPGKWDVPTYLGAGDRHGLSLGYLLAEHSRGVPDSLAAAQPFVQGARVAVGFPDILFRPRDAFVRMGDHLAERGRADKGIVLGLMPTDAPERSDMVALAADGTVLAIDIKPEGSTLQHAWVLALWGPAFTRFLGTYVSGIGHDGAERHLGHVFQSWLADGQPIDAVVFAEGRFSDVGTAGAYGRRFSAAWQPDPVGAGEGRRE